MQNRFEDGDASAGSSPFSRPLRPFNVGAQGVINVADVAEMLADCAVPGETLIVGVTGSVAVGKTTLCASISKHLRSTLCIEAISTDGFLLSNDVLAKLNLSLRKGFPETFDAGRMSGVLQRARYGAVCVPGYSHKLYDRAPDLDRTINRPDILLVEGLGLAPGSGQRNPSTLLDILVYIDAAEEDIEGWFVQRFMDFWRDAETNAESYYSRFRMMSEIDALEFARAIWAGINLPNLRDHISLARGHADIVLRKSPDHGFQLVRASCARSN